MGVCSHMACLLTPVRQRCRNSWESTTEADVSETAEGWQWRVGPGGACAAVWGPET